MFTAEEIEMALIKPDGVLAAIHIALMKVSMLFMFICTYFRKIGLAYNPCGSCLNDPCVSSSQIIHHLLMIQTICGWAIIMFFYSKDSHASSVSRKCHFFPTLFSLYLLLTDVMYMVAYWVLPSTLQATTIDFTFYLFIVSLIRVYHLLIKIWRSPMHG